MPTKSTIFIDSRVSDYQPFIEGLTGPTEVYVLDSVSDGLTQMAADLQGHTGIDAVQVISHGSVGTPNFGSSVLNRGNLAYYKGQDEIDDLKRGAQKGVMDNKLTALAFESQVGMIITDSHEVILRVNRAFTEITGYTEDEAKGHTPRLLSSGHQDAAFYEAMHQTLEQTGAWQGEVWNRRKNGDVFPEWLTITAIQDGDGNTTHFVGTLADITSRKSMEQALKDSEERWKLALDGAEHGVWDWLIPTGEAHFSRQWKEMLGFSENEIADLASEWSSRVHPEDLSAAMAAIQDHIDGKTSCAVVETRLLCKDGRWKWIVGRGMVVSRGSNGEPLRLVGTNTDVTERRQASEILRASEEKYRALIETTGTGYLIVDGAGKVVDANPEYARLAGHGALGDILGQSVIKWTASHDRERNARAVAQCVSEGFIRNLEIDYEDASGRITPIEINATVIGAGESLRIIALCRDISDRKADQSALISSRDEAVELLGQVSRTESALRALNDTLEERIAQRTLALEAANNMLLKAHDELAKSEANAMLATLVAGVSHELSTPLGNGMITASTLGEQSESFRRSVQANQVRRSDLAAFVDSMQAGSALMLRNLERAVDLLENFRQVVNDQASEMRRTFDLAKHVREIVATLAPSLKHKPHRVVLDIAPGILMDSRPGALGQVIINLVINAYLHAFEGRSDGVLVISAQVTTNQVELQIKDNGVGMLPDQVARLFEPFFTTKQGRGGTGLGMAIVSNLVSKILGGQIEVRTEAGIGTQFNVRLPLQSPEDHGQA